MNRHRKRKTNIKIIRLMMLSGVMVGMAFLQGCELYRQMGDEFMREVYPERYEKSFVITDTFICSQSRQIIISTNAKNNSTVIQIHGEAYTLKQVSSGKPEYTNGTYTLDLSNPEQPQLYRLGVPLLKDCERKTFQI